jgi:hypothetical protein
MAQVTDSYTSLLKRSSDLAIHIAPLDTGYSKDVDGQMTIDLPNVRSTTSIDDGTQPLPPARLHYVLQDNNVRVFIPGASH